MKVLFLMLLTLLNFLPVDFVHAQNTSGRIEAITLIQEGDLHLRYGNWEQALFSYTNAIQADITFAEAYMKRGQLFEKTTHTQEALADYSMAIQLNPFVDIYYDQRARVRMLSFDYYGAMNDINSAIDINANNDDYLRHQTDNFISLGMYEKAMVNLKRGVDFTAIEELQREALLSIFSAEYLRADELLQRAIELEGSSYLTFDLLGLLSLEKGEFYDAIRWFDKAIASDSTQYLSFFNRASANRNLGEQALALRDVDTAIRLNQTEQMVFFRRALIKKEQGDFKGAIVDYTYAIEIDSTYENAIYNRAFTYKLSGDFFSAEEDIEFLVNSSKDKPEYWNMHGNIMILKGDLEIAIKSYDNAISYDMNYAEAYYNRAIASLLIHRPIQACEDFERSTELGYDKAKIMSANFCGAF
jgi:tetratricopeptide (TPR) repeat protein